MSTISTTASSGNSIAALLNNVASTQAATTAAAPQASTDAATSSDRGPATSVQLSDKVKSILAEAANDQAVAKRLEAFVQAHRTGGSANTSSNSDGAQPASSVKDVNKAFDQLADTKAQAADSPPDPSLKAAHDFSNGVRFDGFTLGVMASAETGSSRIEMVGPNGISYMDFRFGWSDGFSSGGGGGPGTTMSITKQDNVETITINESEAAATSTTVSTNAQTASTAASVSETTQISFAIDFTTGSIHASESRALTAASAQSATPASSFSTIA